MPWSAFNRLGFRLAAAVSLGLLLFGLVVGSFTFVQEYGRAVEATAVLHQKMVRTLQVQAEIAAFTGNREIANDVLAGLLTDEAVALARLQGLEGFSVEQGRSGAASAERGTATDYPLFSPVERKIAIGALRLVSDEAVVRARAFSAARHAVALLLLQLVFAAIVLAYLFHRVVGRPLRRLATQMRAIRPGDGRRVQPGDDHQRDEIGVLADCTNDLLDEVERSLTEERLLRRQREIDHRKYADVFENAGSGIFIAGRDGRLSSYNKAFAQLTWLPTDLDSPPLLYGDVVWHAPERVETLVAQAFAAYQGQAAVQEELLVIGPTGDERWLNLILVAPGDGTVQGTVTDVTTRKLDELRARKAAVADALTLLLNRAGLVKQFSAIDLADPPFALAVFDLAGFRQINEAFNFAAGDKVLLAISERLRRAVRAADVVARVGADIFAVVLRGEEDHRRVGGRIDALRGLITQPIDIEAGGRVVPVQVDVTAGIALFPRDGHQIDELLRNAELALQAARGGEARPFRFYDASMQAAAESRRRMEDNLREAMASRSLQLYFQPIIELRSGRMAGAEALLRWQDGPRGFVPPDVFIPLAEEIDLIGDLGLYVLDEACRCAAAWRRNGLACYASVNVSAQQIPARLSPRHVADALRRHGLPSQALVLEITEGVLLGDVGAARDWLDAIRASGVRVFLDDFGTGYSSLSYLKRFPMDAVKIDKSFIHDLSATHSDRALVEAIITMARTLGMGVVAEGIESAEQFDLLGTLRCGHGQGFHMSRPVPANEFEATARRIDAAHMAPAH